MHFKSERKKIPVVNPNGSGLRFLFSPFQLLFRDSFTCFIRAEGSIPEPQRLWCMKHHFDLFKKMQMSLSFTNSPTNRKTDRGEKKYIIGIQLTCLWRFESSYLPPFPQVPSYRYFCLPTIYTHTVKYEIQRGLREVAIHFHPIVGLKRLPPPCLRRVFV